MSTTWPSTQLKFGLARPISDGPHETPEFISEGIPFLSVDSIQDGRLVFSNCRYISAEDHARYTMKIKPQLGDILIGKAASTGKIARVTTDVDFNVWSPLAIVRPDQKKFEPRWIEWTLKALDTQAQIDMACTYNTQKNISMGDIGRLRIAMPPLDQQRAIADYLDRETARIDTLIEEQQRLIEMLRERRLAAVEAAVSDVQTSGPRLKHIIQSVRQGWSPQCYAWSADGVEMWAVLKAGAANGGRFRPMENKELPSEETPRPGIVVRRGDLIVSRANTRDLVGSAAVVDGDFPRLMLCDKLYAFTLDEHQALPRFVAAVLGSRRWRDLIELEATGASHSMLNVSQADIVNLPMQVPPIEEQRRVITRLDEQTTRVDRLIMEAERFIELSRERRSALITAAVTGQIDVREVA
ncbi:restriction endonuclease subunit S [Streptomyces sp. NBC_01594]|uniref:restriction endonuclease subunit S n=1 Tax=Streptomyces sp. NBC_01594 TaxID=2975890 RepID=UPI00386691D7